MVTALNIESYVKEYAGGGGGGDEPTVPPDLPAKSNLVLGNTFTWGMFPWVVVHVDDSAQECYLSVGEEETPPFGHSDFSELNAQNNAFASVYLTEGQRAALKYIAAGTTSGRVFSPTEEQVVSTFDYYRTSKSNRIWGMATWWTSTATKFVDTNGNIVQSTSVRASSRPHCCIDMSLYDSQEEPEEPGTNPNWPDKSQLTLGNNINWAGYNWIVSHVTNTEAYLTLNGLSGDSTWYKLQDACTNFANQLTAAYKACLKSVAAGRTSGKVIVATYDQMNGGFSYFNSATRRSSNKHYWTSSDNYDTGPYFVTSSGGFNRYGDGFESMGFRPTVCIDLTLYV